MKNYRKPAIIILMSLLGTIASGQTADSAYTESPLLSIRSPYILDPFPSLPIPIGYIGDTITAPRGFFPVPFTRTVVNAEISPDWSTVTITEISDGTIYKMPLTASLDWYMAAMLERNRQIQYIQTMNGTIEKAADKQDGRRGGKSLELVGVDVGDLGRVSLRVRGNVNISGKMVFQDQQLIHSNINEAQNTHIEFDQKQNLNIEGKIGDRITVLMDQDSERDFDWENNIRITYEGKEDEILQRVEAGNISLSLPATQYVTFSGKNKGLFGLKAISKLGPIDITTIASIEQTRKEKQKFEGSSEASTQRISDYEYMKNRYFFIHEWYRNGVDTVLAEPFQINSFYPLTENGIHYRNESVIKDFELYKSVPGTTPGSVEGVAYVNPDRPEQDADDSFRRNYLRLERGQDYEVSEELGYIRMRSTVSDVVLACTFKIVERDNPDNTLKTIGTVPSGDDTTGFALQLLRAPDPNPGHPSWDLMFKNVYYLGTNNIDPEGFAVRVMNDRMNPVSERDQQGVSYLTHFGLDRIDSENQPNPDEQIDVDNPALVSLVYGELILPVLLPFVSADSIPGGNTTPELQDVLGTGAMYTKTNRNEINGDKRFVIEADYSNQASNISLGFMVVEGSEEVKLNNVILTRGVDYQIDYFGGSLVFLNEDAMSPNANIEVLYEKHELVSFDKKTIVGTRAQMDLGDDSFIGATALYYNQSVLNEKIEVGYEPTRNFIWDLNGRLKTDLDGVTRFLDRMPMIETEKMTTFSLEGELAQVLPNPNPINSRATGDANGVAYIDDFEGSKRTTSPQILQRFWKPSAAPLNFEGEPYEQELRADMFWFNPYTPLSTKEIWPNQSTSSRAQNETTNILWLDLKKPKLTEAAEDSAVWGGIISPFFSGDYDQTRSKFFEIWLRGTEGKFTVDLGRISEDWNSNGLLDTEDKPGENGINQGNGFLEDDEDVGLDGCADDYEDGWGGCLDPLGLTFSEYLANQDTLMVNLAADPDDPNGDNWSKYTGGVPGSSNGPDNVNGTEGNRRQEGGIYPDTEDIDGSGFLDKVNDYFTKSFYLDPSSDDTTYLSGETVRDNGDATGWKLYRIPLSHFSKINPDGNIDWNDIRNIRMSVSHIDSHTTIQIAKIELVGNEWFELGVKSDSTNYAIDDSVFAVTIINTEDNPEYNPPDGVKGEYDRINQIRSKEQSLVLKFDNLEGYHEAAAEKTLMELTGARAQSYLSYDRMKMFVYGSSSNITATHSDVEFFLRFGRGEDFYEISQPVYDGWDKEENRNSIDLDLEWLTSLKQADSTNVKKLNSTDIFTDSLNYKKYYFVDPEGELTGKKVIVKGLPALSRIQFVRAGVRNKTALPITGEVWLDEFRLSGVKKDRGVAMRVQTKLNLADLGNVSVAYSRREADFHVLQERLGSANTSEDFRINGSLSLNKFLPKSWGLKIPLSTSYARSTQRPKYHPRNKDILLGDGNIPDSLLTINNSINFSTSVSKTTKSERPLVKYTIDKISTSFSAKRGVSSSFQVEENLKESYAGKISYSLPFGKNNYISPLKWMGGVPLIGKHVKGFNLYYTPSNISATMSFSESLTQNTPRIGKKTDNYNLGLSRNFTVDYKLTESIRSVKYTQAIASDMDQYRGYAWMAVRDLDPGTVTNITEGISSSFAPSILAWLKPNFSYSAQYRWNKPIGSTVDGANIGTGLNFSSSMNFSPTKLVELVYTPPKTSSRRRGAQNNSEENDKKGFSVLGMVHKLSKKINPVNVRYTSNLTRSGLGVQGTVPVGYKFGWLPDHGMDHAEEVGTNTGNWKHSQDISLNSGLKLTNNISSTFSFSQNVSSNISGSGNETRTMKRGILAYGEVLENTLPFPGWNISWKGLQKWPVLKKFTRSVSLEHRFNGSESRNWNTDSEFPGKMPLFGLGSFIDENLENENASQLTASFSPLLGVTMQLNKGVSFTTRFNYSKSIDGKNGGQTFKVDKAVSSSATYSHKGGLTIPLPFLENVDIQNNMNFTLNFDYSDNATKTRAGMDFPFDKARKVSNWKAGLGISYSFTSRVTGGINYQYRESDNFTTGKKIDRDFGFDVKIAISG